MEGYRIPGTNINRKEREYRKIWDLSCPFPRDWQVSSRKGGQKRTMTIPGALSEADRFRLGDIPVVASYYRETTERSKSPQRGGERLAAKVVEEYPIPSRMIRRETLGFVDSRLALGLAVDPKRYPGVDAARPESPVSPQRKSPIKNICPFM